jgi:hypothetical protein
MDENQLFESDPIRVNRVVVMLKDHRVAFEDLVNYHIKRLREEIDTCELLAIPEKRAAVNALKNLLIFVNLLEVYTEEGTKKLNEPDIPLDLSSV